jgi:hypothetical protein
MHASAKLLAGGTYTQNFFETNPPMILFLYIPPVIAAKLSGLSLAIALRVYIFLLALTSIYCCYRLAKKLFSTTDYFVLNSLLITLSIAFVVLPAYEFGQREQLMIILVMPYLFACPLRLNKLPISPLFAIFIGIFAGLGFAIKPFFLIPLCLIELMFILYNKSILGWVRVESLTILVVMLSYLLLVFTVTPDYITVVLPLLLHLYYPGFHTELSVLLFKDRFIFCLILPVVFYFLTYKQPNYRTLRLTLFVALLGFILAYLAENTLWYYHLLPTLTATLLLTCLLAALTFPLKSKFSLAHLANLSYWVALFWFPVTLIYQYNVFALTERHASPRHDLSIILRNLPQYKSFYFFTTSGHAFPSIVDEANKIPVSRFPNYWWLPGLINLSHSTKNPSELKKLNDEQNYFLNTVNMDIKMHQPDLIIVDTREYNMELKQDNFSYIDYFSNHSSDFKLLWEQYMLLLKTYGFDIYVRKSEFARLRESQVVNYIG